MKDILNLDEKIAERNDRCLHIRKKRRGETKFIHSFISLRRKFLFFLILINNIVVNNAPSLSSLLYIPLTGTEKISNNGITSE
jgi:hypothetical protein